MELLLPVGLMIAIKNLREDEPWMRAWAALRAWSWCKDRSTPDRLMKWLKALVHGNMLTKRDVHKILDYLVVKMVSPCPVQWHQDTTTLAQHLCPSQQTTMSCWSSLRRSRLEAFLHLLGEHSFSCLCAQHLVPACSECLRYISNSVCESSEPCMLRLYVALTRASDLDRTHLMPPG